MSANRREKERRRQARLSEERAEAQAKAKWRERYIYLGIGVVLLVLAGVTAAILTSRGASHGPTLTPVVSPAQEPLCPL
jgi:flagellar basal body-associated protein FliL